MIFLITVSPNPKHELRPFYCYICSYWVGHVSDDILSATDTDYYEDDEPDKVGLIGARCHGRFCKTYYYFTPAKYQRADSVTQIFLITDYGKKNGDVFCDKCRSVVCTLRDKHVLTADADRELLSVGGSVPVTCMTDNNEYEIVLQ